MGVNGIRTYFHVTDEKTVMNCRLTQCNENGYVTSAVILLWVENPNLE
jgi:hypothetical protein